MGELVIDYDKENDILFIRFDTSKKQADIQEPVEGVVVYLAEDSSIIGLEIWDAKKRGILDRLREIVLGETE